MEENLPTRKAVRLSGFDYSQKGAYFITICTQYRKNILSTIVGEGSPLPRLTSYGKIAEKWIQNISANYHGVSMDSYVIMPNHIHLLLSIEKEGGRGDPSPTIGAAMGWLKYQMTKEINQMRGVLGDKVFQRSYYDHIVRNREDYQAILQYIYENPMRWQFDKLYVTE